MTGFNSKFVSDGDWFVSVNVDAVDDEARRSILEAVKNKLGFTKACEVLGIVKPSLHRYLSGERRIPNDVVRNALRFLTSPETFGWVMEVVPSRSYKLDVRPYQISLEEVKETLEFLKNEHQTYYIVYRVMLESGARFEHVLKMIEEWNPDEVIEIPNVGIESSRLVCFEDRGFCRYYMGLKGSEKPCEWIYFSMETLEALEEIAPTHINRSPITKYAKRRELILPKYVRKIAWRLMIKAIPREAARFIQSRFGELRVSEARYEDLLGEADEVYSNYLKILEEEIVFY